MNSVVITAFAISQIEVIYDYYYNYVSLKIAKKIKSEIISAINSLKKFDVEWQEEEYLLYLQRNHRRLVCGNYKIIYYLNIPENRIYVTDIFDSRQDPAKERG